MSPEDETQMEEPAEAETTVGPRDRKGMPGMRIFNSGVECISLTLEYMGMCLIWDIQTKMSGWGVMKPTNE